MPLLLPPHRPEIEAAPDTTVDSRVRAQLEELIGRIDLGRELKRLAYGGCDSLEDYEKYGDLFVEVS